MDRTLAFPFRVGPHGRAAIVARSELLRQRIEEVLFTVPGERVNRPTFGCSLLGLVFEEGRELVHGIEAIVQGELHRWLGDLLRVESIDITTEEARVTVCVTYVESASGVRRQAVFAR